MKKDTSKPQTQKKIEWSEIHQQVEKAGQSLAQDAAPSMQEGRAILIARARALAREPEQVNEAQEFIEIIEFQLASETYGIESALIREVYPLKDFTPLPGLPPFVLGIANVRGQILSIIDLKKFFNLPEKGLGQLNKLIILRNPQMEFGILADEVLGTRSVALESLQAAPPTVSGVGAGYVRGVTAGRVIILDAERILNDGQIIVDQAS